VALKTIELMDGAPVRGELIPVRAFISDINLWPFVSFPGSPLTVEHYFRVSMEDENGKQYGKRLPIDFGRYWDGELPLQSDQAGKSG
jgi:vacuolar protein sorting-associated protein 26